MTIWEAIILGAVQGLTEFLPVSSSGHEVLAAELLGFDPLAHDTALSSDARVSWIVLVHLASALAICVFLIWDLKHLPFGRQASSAAGNAPNHNEEPATGISQRAEIRRSFLLRWMQFLVLGTIPAGVAYLLLKHTIEASVNAPLVVGIALIVNGTVLFLLDRFKPNGDLRLHRVAPLSGGGLRILAVGMAQALALIPGLSRSGMTITVGLWAGLERAEAVRYSFYLGLIAILAATAAKFREVGELTATLGADVMVAGFLSSFFFSLGSLWALYALVRGMRLIGFAVYCWIVGNLTVIMVLLQ